MSISSSLKCFLNCPAVDIKTRADGPGMDTCNFCPFGDCFCHAFVSNKPAGSAVSGLKAFVNPLAIFFVVWAIVVFAVNLVAFARSRSHVVHEVDEAGCPLIANSYAARPIPCKTKISLVPAPLNYQSPNSVFIGFRKSVRSSLIVMPYMRQMFHCAIMNQKAGVCLG